MESALTPRKSPGAAVSPLEPQGFRLSTPSGDAKHYRIAQLDDYGGLPRRAFPHIQPIFLQLEARASSNRHPGTWGFGFWNAPFSLGIGYGVGAMLPALPQTAWFFHASPENHLSFRDDLPGNGFLAQSFRSARLPGSLFAPLAPLLPALAFRRVARAARRTVQRRLVHDEGRSLAGTDPTDWHTYSIELSDGLARFQVDGHTILEDAAAPAGPLGLVIWIDNQFAAFRPDGSLGYGLLENPEPAWIEIRSLILDGDTSRSDTIQPR